MNARISLDGRWDFLYVNDGSPGGPAEVREITVPGPWQAQFSDLRTRAGIGIYRRLVEIPPGWRNGRVFLCFGAVFHLTRVWVNGVPVGMHEGGFLPFRFEVSEQLVEGDNEIKVRVESPTDNPLAYPDAPFAEIPFGKQSWYGPLSGIWQSVYLERRAPDYIARLKVVAELAGGFVRVTLFFDRPVATPLDLACEARDPEGRIVAAGIAPIGVGTEEAALALRVETVRAWSPDRPDLYLLEATLCRNGEPQDRQRVAFGFRAIETRHGRLYLNGEPIYLRGALDQDYYPDGICTAPSAAYIEDEFRKAKELGLNCLRCHIKAADPRYYEAADRVGLLIWTELPNGGLSTDRSRTRKERLLKGIVDRDCNHPSIIIWTIINENWGVDLVNDADHRAWLKRTFAWLKSYDPTRLVVDNSPLSPSFHVETDIADYHFYAAFPDNRAAWDSFVDEFAHRAAWLFSQAGDAVTNGREPLICSEFGNWGLPDPQDLRDDMGREPWWFETGHDWGEGVMYAHGVENRFRDWSLDRAFGRLSSFVQAAQWQQFRALKYEIETMRRHEQIAGYIITEFTDVHWESNGLLDMRRNRRAFHDVFRTINADTVIAPRWERLTYWAGETVRIEFAIAHGAGAPIENATLEVDAPGVQPMPVARVEAGQTLQLGAISFPAPAQTGPAMHRIDMRLRLADGRELSRNALDMAIHPRPDQGLFDELPVWSPEPRLRARLDALGYVVAGDLRGAQLVVATRQDETVTAFVRGGGSLLHLCAVEESLYPFFPHWQNVRVRKRAGTQWAGNWASTFAWLRRSGPFASLPGGPLIDETFDRVIPTHVISGCNLLDFQGRVQAGLVIGWIHKPVALVVDRSYGRGRFVGATFRLLRDAPGRDPTATVLLRQLMLHALGRSQETLAHPSDGEAA